MAIQRLLDGLRDQGVAPVVFCPRLQRESNGDPLAHSGVSVQRFKAFVPVLGLSPERKRQLVAVGGNLMSFELISSLWRQEELSIVHTHTLGRIGGIGLTIAKQRRLPFVVTVHGGVLDLPEKIKRSFNAPIEQGWEWGKLFGFLFQSHRLFRDAGAILTCNQREAALLQAQFPSKHIVVQPHGIPFEIYQRDQRQAARDAFPEVRGRQVLLCLGRIDPIKNQVWLLEQAGAFFKRHPRALLVLAGPCTDEPYGNLVHTTIRKLGFEQRVLLTGGFPPDDPRLVGLLQVADLLLLPSLSETFGLVILEAWAAGTPVLAARASGPASLVKQGENGWLFDLDNPQGFHEALDSALKNPEMARQTAKRGAVLAAKHSTTALAGKMKVLYELLLEEKQCAT